MSLHKRYRRPDKIDVLGISLEIVRRIRPLLKRSGLSGLRKEIFGGNRVGGKHACE